MRFPPDQLWVSARNPVGVLGYRSDVSKLIPHAKEGIISGEKVLVVPHGVDETRLLSNLGIVAPAPILHRYDWAGNTPFEAQRQTAALLTTNPRAFVLNEMATGKTLSALFAFDYLRRTRKVRKMLVVAPLSTLRQTWKTEIRDRMPHLRVAVLHGPQKKLLLRAEADIYLINHDGLRHIDMSGVVFDILCVDELTAFKNATAKRSKIARKLAQEARWVWGLTGTPMAQGPEDAYGQVLLVNPDNVPRSFSRWRDKVCLRVSQFKWVPRKDANDIVFAAMSPAVRFRRDEVVELPPISYLWRHAEMSATQRSVYNTVLKHLRAQVETGEVTAANEGVKLSKLLQVASGFIYASGGAAALDPRSRLDMVAETAQEAEGKVIVFSPFRAGVSMIREHFDGLHIGAVEVTGAVTGRRREDAFDAFREDEDVKVLVAHPLTMSHGLNLTHANVIIWAAPYPSLEVYEQANARITRPGQKRHQLVVRVTGSAVEARVYKRLEARETMQNALLGMFEE